MKKIVAMLLSCTMVLALSACGKKTESQTDESSAQSEQPIEVVVFAAASMEATLTQIAEQYKTVAPNISLVFNFDSSGILRDQIREGAVCDLFISAGQKQMNQLDAEDSSGQNQDNSDFIYSDSRINLVENKVVLAVPDDNPAKITSFQDLASDKCSLLCIGNSDVPVGSYSLEILEHLGISISQLETESKVTYATNVTEVATQIKEGVVDCGIIYATDAFTHGLSVVDKATAEMCSQVVYPAAVVKNGTEASVQAAQDFLDYLHTNADAASVLENVGFSVLH